MPPSDLLEGSNTMDVKNTLRSDLSRLSSTISVDDSKPISASTTSWPSKTLHASHHVSELERSSVRIDRQNHQSSSLVAKQEEACRLARKMYEKAILQEHTRLLDMTDNFPKFHEAEIVYGEILGKGGFSTVSEVRGFALKDYTGVRRRRSFGINRDIPDGEALPGEFESRKFMAAHVFRNEGDARYAIKKLSPEITNDPETLITGMADMVNEARILSAMEHPNIVKLRAIKAGDRFQPDFFIIMDRLHETLEERIEIRRLGGPRKSILHKMTKMFRTQLLGKTTNYQDSIVCAYHLSSALKYMHKQRLIHRDLKPENIGFDVRGDIKIFDFGLSKEMPQENGGTDSAYRFTAMCGSPRYMAEEVALGRPYNEKCDVYSFAILFWEMLSLQTPYPSHTYQSLIDQVWNEPHLRPNLVKLRLPSKVRELICDAWHSDFRMRPSMKHIGNVLKEECMTFPNVSLESLGHRRRKSRVIYDKQNAVFRLNPDEFEGKMREYKMG